MPERDYEMDAAYAENALDRLADASIPALQKRAHACAKKSGFYALNDVGDALVHRSGGVAGLIALIHSELSEALEADRKGDSANFAEELADVAIRLFDLAEFRSVDLEAEILQKMDRNDRREFRHGGKSY